jgi:hypothetical protein
MHAKPGSAQCAGREARKATAWQYCPARELGMEGCERIAVGTGMEGRERVAVGAGSGILVSYCPPHLPLPPCVPISIRRNSTWTMPDWQRKLARQWRQQQGLWRGGRGNHHHLRIMIPLQPEVPLPQRHSSTWKAAAMPATNIDEPQPHCAARCGRTSSCRGVHLG